MMRRRRLLRGRPFAPQPVPPAPMGPQGLPEPADPLLVDANRRFQIGDYAGAAVQFETLAERTAQRRPRLAPRLWMEAGRARLFAGDREGGLRLILRGLDFLARLGHLERVQQAASRVTHELREQGFPAEADKVVDWLKQQSGSAPVEQPQQHERSRVRLPLHCASCGGPLDPREVEWASEDTAECPYCGGMVRGEEG